MKSLLKHLKSIFQESSSKGVIRGVIYHRNWWARRRNRPGRFQTVHSAARGFLTRKDRYWFSPLAKDEFQWCGKSWFLDVATGEVTIADTACGICTTHILANGQALLMEMGCLKVVDSLGELPLDMVVPAGSVIPHA